MTIQTFDDANSDEARQALLDRRAERTHPKRHRTLNRRRRLNAKKKQKIKHAATVRAKVQERYQAAVHAYWTGQSDGHP